MRGLNDFKCLGNLGRTPEVKTVGDSKVASFSVAINENYKDKSGTLVEKTEWINCVAWGNLAGIAEKYLSKGSKLYLEGKMQTRSYEKDGEKRYSTEIVARNFIMLDSKTDSSVKNSDNKTDWKAVKSEEVGDLPF